MGDENEIFTFESFMNWFTDLQNKDGLPRRPYTGTGWAKNCTRLSLQ